MKTFFNFIVANNPARISPKEISGANGKFLPKPLLFHLRLPNSKKSSRVFCEILLLTEAVHLSHFDYKMFKVLRLCPTQAHPKNSFRKTSADFFVVVSRPQKGVWGMNAGGLVSDFSVATTFEKTKIYDNMLFILFILY
ncbi:MAG: hypothetical protein V1877_02385 [Candidatus Tagabacteria bacterium]